MENVQLYHAHVPWMDNEGRKKVKTRQDALGRREKELMTKRVKA